MNSLLLPCWFKGGCGEDLRQAAPFGPSCLEGCEQPCPVPWRSSSSGSRESRVSKGGLHPTLQTLRASGLRALETQGQASPPGPAGLVRCPPCFRTAGGAWLWSGGQSRLYPNSGTQVVVWAAALPSGEPPGLLLPPSPPTHRSLCSHRDPAQNLPCLLQYPERRPERTCQ